MSLGVIILAAGDGKRMQSELPKMLHKLAGIPILSRVLMSSLDLPNVEQIVVVAGNHIKDFEAVCGSMINSNHSQPIKTPEISWAYQQFPLGTADAVITGLMQIKSTINKVLVISGDLPLISTNTLTKLITETPLDSIGMVASNIKDPFGFGRIIRNQQGKFLKIIEQSEASVKEALITEINVGVYLFPKLLLEHQLPKLNNDNIQKEYYLTDVMSLAVENNINIFTIEPENNLESFSINTRKQLIELERAYQLYQAYKLVDNGVTVIDPHRLDLRGNIKVSKDVELDLNVILEGHVIIEKGVKIGANCYIKDTTIQQNVIIKPNSFIEGAIIESQAQIGPFARIRPKTHIKSFAKIGNFVEVKSSLVGEKSKVNHLSYIGDATIGTNVNVGAGSITCNYDGVNKYETTIQDNVMIGAGCQLIAPINVAENATIAAGTTLINNAPLSKLTLNKKIQYSIDWTRPDKKNVNSIKSNSTERLD